MSKRSFGIVCGLTALLWGAPDARAITAPGHTVTEIVLPDFAQGDVVVVGDGDGTVGVGYGKAKEVPAAIAKGVEEAKKHFFKVPRIQGTIPHPVQGEKAAGVVLLRPAAPGLRTDPSST